jgi:hypothetical protein
MFDLVAVMPLLFNITLVLSENSNFPRQEKYKDKWWNKQLMTGMIVSK